MGDKWQISVVGMQAGVNVIEVAANQDEFRSITITKLRKLIHENCSYAQTEPEDMRMIYAGKQLQDKLGGSDATLEDYNIVRNASIQLVFRLPGGQDVTPRKITDRMQPPRSITERMRPPPEVDKVHDLSNFSLKFTTQQPDAINPIMTDSDSQPRIIMSCGHAVDANSLTTWCRKLLGEHQYRFYCPAVVDERSNKQCKKVWEYDEVRLIAHLTEAEERYFEYKISACAAMEFCDYKECPGCRSFVERKDIANLRVHCFICTKVKQKCYDFCWNCDKEWSGPTTSSVKCGNPKCEHPCIPLIRDAPMCKLQEVEMAAEVPIRRACPTCGLVVEHNRTKCKMVICPRCKNEFCFLCLELKTVCLASAPLSWYKAQCTKGIAPRQTEIPVWSRR